MLLRFDPFRDLERLTETATRPATALPMDAVRRKDGVVIHVDVPGASADGVDLTVERNVLTVQVERGFDRQEGDEVLAAERRHGSFTRQFFLGDTLDTEKVEADVTDGVLTVRIPVAETAAPRKISVSSSSDGHQAIEAESSEA